MKDRIDKVNKSFGLGLFCFGFGYVWFGSVWFGLGLILVLVWFGFGVGFDWFVFVLVLFVLGLVFLCLVPLPGYHEGSEKSPYHRTAKTTFPPSYQGFYPLLLPMLG